MVKMTCKFIYYLILQKLIFQSDCTMHHSLYLSHLESCWREVMSFYRGGFDRNVCSPITCMVVSFKIVSWHQLSECDVILECGQLRLEHQPPNQPPCSLVLLVSTCLRFCLNTVGVHCMHGHYKFIFSSIETKIIDRRWIAIFFAFPATFAVHYTIYIVNYSGCVSH